ncbi:PTS glucitol/sorbitol transporter subunit IIA [Niallia sp. FSL W8-0177]|uniref:PTS glucitol/sorbitol transporter subunit IIA n=1 Tax=Niallia TaxID=2837506 RepID=UPI00201D9E15|nr:PTS glucitol/sorbitol transporter subunit IIA [Niallia circulans]
MDYIVIKKEDNKTTNGGEWHLNMPVKMKTIYENTINSIGSLATSFVEEKMIILFGEGAPKELAEFCYGIEVVGVKDRIKTGQKVMINNESYEITSVGEIVEQNLTSMGHITLRFNGATTPELPGTLYIEDKDMPVLEIGTKIRIVSE